MRKEEEAGEELAKVGWKQWRGEQLTKRANALRVEGSGRRGRPRLRWKNCMERDLAGVGVEWRMRARDRGECRRLVELAVKRY